jgi:O-antigen biosynthesis protein
VFRHFPTMHPLLDALQPRVICEIGVFRGKTTQALLRTTEERGVVVHAIDPTPQEDLDVEGLQAQYGERFIFHRARSLDVLPDIRDADAILIDGDHNWFTVYHELTTIARVAAEEQRPFPLTFLHDVEWPFADRDMYFDPDSIPEEHRQPYARGGVLPNTGDLVDGDGMNAGHYNALTAGGPRNGVRTAVDDFLDDVDAPVRSTIVFGFFGLAILYDERQLDQRPDLRSHIEQLNAPETLIETCRRIERARVRLLIELQKSRRLAARPR